MIFHKLPIKKKIRYAILITAYTILLLTICVQITSEYMHSRNLMVNNLETLSELIKGNGQVASMLDDPESANQLLSSFSTTEEIKAAYLINARGERVAAYHRDKEQPRDFSREALNQPLNQPTTIFSRTSLELYRPINIDGQFIGAIYIQSGLGEFYLHLVKMLVQLLVVGILSVILAAVLSYRLQRRLSDPITKLAETISEITEQRQYDRQVQKFDVDEIGQLYDCFNEMLLQITAQNEKLQQNQSDLEETVTHRTCELNKANEWLKENLIALKEDKEAALDAVKAKSSFLANMSHEIRTPMNGVLGMLDLIKDTSPTKVQSDYLNTAYTSANSLLQIINDILDFSKIEVGKMTVERIDICMGDIIEEVCSLLAGSARDKGLKLSCYTDTDLPSILESDPVRLRQILTNLIGNAIKFTDQGEIRVRANLLERSKERATLELVVEDTGIGIAPDVLPKLFNDFIQADGTTTRKYGGTGLGLTISRQLVELMDGHMTVDSTLGSGSTFTVRLEMKISKKHHLEKSGVFHALEGLKTLIVEDNATDREILRHYLTAWGLDHHEAITAQEALGLLKEAAKTDHPFELVFLDLDMPDMDGLELSKRIEQDAALASIRRIMLSSTSMLAKSQQQEAGISAWLTKPFRQSALLDTTMQVMHYHSGFRNLENVQVQSELPVFSEEIQILLVEDNIVNQKVALSILKKAGLQRVDLAEDGQQAVTLFGSQTYDLILMDCQMPVMNGYEATGLIRQKEKEQQLPRTPIVAMTANAMAGDREKCLAAGMDDYLSKPINIKSLIEKLEHWLIHDNSPIDSTDPESTGMDINSLAPSPEHAIEAPLIDQAVLSSLKELMEDEFPVLIDCYVKDAPKLMADIRQSSKNVDMDVLVRAAHTLKSSSNNVGALQLGTIAAAIEKEGRENNLKLASALIPALHVALDQTLNVLRSLD